MKTQIALIFVLVPLTFSQEAFRGNGQQTGNRDTTCGTAFYDDGTSEDASFFGGGQAGDPNQMFGVLFQLDDFGFVPGSVRINGFCAGNDISFFGGPWPNRVVLYPDIGGIPNEATELASGIISTGDGGGQVTVAFADITLDGDFWLMNRGDVSLAGEDFNMEIDLNTVATGNSFFSQTGIGGLTPSMGNYVLHANIGVGVLVPTLGEWGLVAMVLLLAIAALITMRRSRNRVASSEL